MKLRTSGPTKCPNTTMNESSVHEKRKKRLECAIVVKMSPESQLAALMRPRNPNVKEKVHESGQQANFTSPSRRKFPSSLCSHVTIIIIITQLLCDMAGSSLLTSVVGAASDSEPSQIRFQLDNVDSTNAGPRFLEEPGDTWALEGQREIPLRCVILADRDVTPSWSKGNRIIAIGSKSQGQKQVSVTLRRQRPPAAANATSGPAGTGSQASLSDTHQHHLDSLQDNSVQLANTELAQLNSDSNSTMIVYNYTLLIANVSLENEGQYQCGAGLSIQSQRVWLRVVRPPAKLEVFVRPTLDATFSGSDPSDTPTSLVPASPTTQTNSQQPQVVEVRHDALVRLECRASGARPRAELVWLDGATGRQLAPRLATPTSSDDPGGVAINETDDTSSSLSSSSTSEELIGANDESDTLIWTFKVRRDQHHLRVFTCRAKHKAYELLLPETSTQQQSTATRSVQLSVVYAPELELLRDPPQPEEGAPLTLRCQAHARPPVQSYAWLVDGHLLEGASEPELHIANLTRQLHMREIKCQANNSIGTSAASVWLSIRYAPAYVTHLMPASLQPDYYASLDLADPNPARLRGSRPSTGRGNRKLQNRLEQVAVTHRAISRELAYGADEHEEVTLRCDFDAQPAPAQLEWFRIVTDYESLANVSSLEADELLESGANHARFKLPIQLGGVANFDHPQAHLDDLNAPERRHTSNKRHIYPTKATSGGGDHHHLLMDELEPGSYRQELDFGLMSSELLHEMEQLRRRQADHLAAVRLRNSSLHEQDVPKYVESLAQKREPRSDQQHDIGEPLALQVRQPDWRMRLALQQRQRNLMRLIPSSDASSSHLLRLTAEPGVRSPQPAVNRPLELVLADTAEQLADATSLPANNNSTQRHNWQPMPIVTVTRPRKAQVVSTQIRLPPFNLERVGRYVCKATGANYETETAKSIFVVMRQRPRLISIANQFVPLGALPLQVECLAQVNTVDGNQTQIKWFKDNKPIDVMHKVVVGQREKSFSIVEQLSPDGLFMRSRLQIHGAEINDFGKYNCTISNPLGWDTMTIELAPLAPTGFAFMPLAGTTLGLISLFFVVICLLLFLVPCRRLDSKLAAAHTKSSTALLKGKSVIVVATDTARHLGSAGPNGQLITSDVGGDHPSKPRAAATNSAYSSSSVCSDQSSSRSSLRKSGVGTGAAGDELDGVSAMTQRADDQDHFVSAPVSACGQIHGQRRPESALSSACAISSSTFAGGAGQYSRASLRSQDQQQQQYQTPRGSVLLVSGDNNSPTKTRFAAIHESLESKLHFGSHQNQNQAGADEQVPAQVVVGNESDDAQTTVDKRRAGGSFIGRLKSKFQGESGRVESSSRNNPARRSLGAGTDKRRPTISMPIERNSPGGNNSHQKPTAGVCHLMMAHLNKGGPDGGQAQSHLISSSAVNLIQDSAASASDGGHSAATTTTSSGRSSSTSQQQPPPHMYPNHFAYTPAEHYLVASMPHQQQQQWHHHQVHPTMTTCDTNTNHLYANGGQHTQPQSYTYQPQLYANESQSSSSNPYGMLGGVVAAAAPQVAPADQYQQHYQMPLMLSSEPYLAAQHHLPPPPPPPPPPHHEDDARPCYAAICGQQQQQNHLLNGMHSAMQQPAIMVPTSDGGDAYFESNYGTLLSQSSAYKTLGYYQQPQHELSSSSSSSTPNSLTTHANISNPPRLQTLKFTSSCPSGGTTANLSTSHQLTSVFHTENNKLEEQQEEEEQEQGESQVAEAASATDMNNECQEQPGTRPAFGQANGSSSPHENACQESLGSVSQQHAVTSGGPMSHANDADLATNV